MIKLSIITGKDNPLLRAKNAAIGRIDGRVCELIDAMEKTMDELKGIGLAAPQVGENLRFFLVDQLAFHRDRSEWNFEGIPNPDVSHGYVFINPVISVFPKPNEPMVEGCLSLPGWEGNVTRSRRIRIKAQNEKGQAFTLRARGLLAKVLQHEYDHLQGTLIADKWKNPKPVERRKSISSANRHLLGKEKIVFFGTSEYSRIILERLKGTAFAPHIVITRKNDLALLDQKIYALGILAFFGGIIPSELLGRFRFGIINIHPSLLPKYRGPSPVQQAIINGEKRFGVSIIKLDKKVDAGPILIQKELVLHSEEAFTTPDLHQALFSFGADLLVRVLPPYIQGSLIPRPQDEQKATFTPLIIKEDGHIDWKESASLIERKIRAYQPWPLAYTFFTHGQKIIRLQILEAISVVQNGLIEPFGTVISKNGRLLVQCETGLLFIKKLRPEGKNEMSGEAFLRGYKVDHFEMGNISK